METDYDKLEKYAEVVLLYMWRTLEKFFAYVQELAAQVIVQVRELLTPFLGLLDLNESFSEWSLQ